MSVRSRLPRPPRIFPHGSAPATPGETTADSPEVPIVGLTLYTGDALAFGYLALSASRVTDLMNEHDLFEFVDTYLQSIDDGHGLALRSVVITREEIFAVAVAGPRGDPRRRKRTRPIPIELRLGPYDVRGNIHVPPGTDPIIAFRNRRTMVPLTEATVEWDAPDGRQVAQWETVVVNRLLTNWIAPARRDVRPRNLQLVPEVNSSGLGRVTSQLPGR